MIAPALKLGFLATVIGVTWSTLADTNAMTAGLWDKGLHFVAFYLLSVAGAVAFPRFNLFALAGGMCLFGLCIEALQSLPQIPHDASWKDFFADMGGVAAGLGPIFLDRTRRRLSRRR